VSVHVSSWAWRQTVGSAAAKLLLVKLADNANDLGQAWPSHRRLARECEMSRRTVQRRLEELETLGLVTIVEEQRKGRSNLYQLAFLDVRHSDAPTDSDVRHFDAAGAPPVTQQVRHSSDALTVSNRQEPSPRERAEIASQIRKSLRLGKRGAA
jgi:DNA-binding transcriptional MocR family regulator